MKKEIINRYFLYISLLTMFVAIYYGIYNSRLYLIAFAINIITIILGNFKMTFSQLFFLIPFSMIYKLTPSSSSLFTFGMLLTAIISFVRWNRGNSFLYGYICFFALYLYVGLESDYVSLLKIIGGLLCLTSFIKNCRINDIKDIIISSALGILGASYLGLSKITNPNISQYFGDLNSEWMNGEQVFRFSGLMQDPNYYSVSVIVTVFLLFRLFQTKSANRILTLTMIISLVVFGSLSYSRIYIVALVLMMAYFTNILMKKSRYRLTAVLSVVLFTTIAWYYIGTSTFFQNISLRFEAEDVSSGRTTIWWNYLEYIFSNPIVLLVGAGLDASFVGKMGAHNTYIEVLHRVGIIGGIIYTILLISIIKSRRLNNLNLEKCSLLFIFLIMIGTLGFFQMNDFSFYLMFVWISMFYTSKDIIENNKHII